MDGLKYRNTSEDPLGVEPDSDAGVDPGQRRDGGRRG